MCLSLRTDAVLGIGGVRMGVRWFIMDDSFIKDRSSDFTGMSRRVFGSF